VRRYAKIPSDPRLLPLRGGALNVYLALAIHARGGGKDEEPSAWPSVPRIAAITGFTVRAVRLNLRRLEALELIELIFPGGGRSRSTTYGLLAELPESTDDAAFEEETRKFVASFRKAREMERAKTRKVDTRNPATRRRKPGNSTSETRQPDSPEVPFKALSEVSKSNSPPEPRITAAPGGMSSQENSSDGPTQKRNGATRGELPPPSDGMPPFGRSLPLRGGRK